MHTKNRLKELRKERGFTRKSFAQHLGIPFSTLRNYELSINEPREEFWISISQYFDVSLDYLLGISNERASHNTNVSTEDEQELLRKYRKLDSHGKKLIKIVIDHEVLRDTSVPYHQSYYMTPDTHETR